MFKIIEGDFKNNKYSNEEYLDNWPMLYILENGNIPHLYFECIHSFAYTKLHLFLNQLQLYVHI